MPKQHVTMRRVYDAALKHQVIKGASPLTELTDVLGIEARQRVKNWDMRGASAEAMLLIQEKTGINATWVATGEGPEMVAGWPPGRREASNNAQQVVTEPSEAEVVGHLAKLLARVAGKANMHRIAEQLAALALGPDSVKLQNDIVAGLRDPGADIAVTYEDKTVLVQVKEWRQQAMRLAEAADDLKERAIVTKFLGMLDTVMRDQPDPSKPAPRLSRSKG